MLTLIENKPVSMKWFIPALIWQFPQCVAAMIMLLIVNKPSTESYKHAAVIRTNFSFCFSLGFVIFLGEGADDTILKHEYGHTRQSLYLGWLYLFAVGIPSLCLFWWRRHKRLSLTWYHSKYPENWATKLGDRE